MIYFTDEAPEGLSNALTAFKRPNKVKDNFVFFILAEFDPLAHRLACLRALRLSLPGDL